ncbi:MAG: shikimate dehydrogenase [Clostridiales bacterium]|nr:shikimate dehydrogenase [Clostridiales bacterium]
MEYGLIGEKLGHSFSKEIHEKLADYQYNITPLTREEFPEFMKARDFKAINVTIPYKCDVIPYLDEMDSNAKSIGAVNTIVNKEGKLIGHNTDFSGFLYMVEHHKVTIEGKKILVIGNGGASKAVIAVLNHLQAKEIIIIDIVSGPGVITKEEAVKNHTDVDVIINTSPVGMYPNVDQSPIDLTLFPHCKAVLDIIYNPLQTKLTKQASELGMQAINGLEMLVGQAKYAVEFFLDKSIDDDVIDPIYHQIMTDMMKL